MSKDIENPHANIQDNQHQPQRRGVIGRVQDATAAWKDNADFRMRICNTCPHYSAPRCDLCGCFMIAKTKIPQASCPAGKW